MIKYKHVASSLFYGIPLMLLIIVMAYQPGYGMEVKAPLIKEKASPLTQTGGDILEISNTSPSSSSGTTHTSLMHEGDVDSSAVNSESISYHYTEQDHQSWFRLLTMIMAHRKEVREVATLLDEGKSKGYINKPVLYGDDAYTPMHRAAQDGDLEMVKTLASSKYSASLGKAVGTYHQTPLHLAAAEGRIDVVKYLLSEDPGLIHARDIEGEGVLQYVAAGTYAENNVGVTKYLVTRHGANLNEKIRGLNLLHFAIGAGNLDMVEYLLTENYLLIEEEVDGIFPFDFALNRNEEVIAAKISCFVAARATHNTTVR